MTTIIQQCPIHTKSISFDSSVVIHDTLHVADFTAAEREACWLSTSELSRTRSEVRSMAKKLAKRQRPRNLECTRGVEPYSDAHILQRNLVRRQAQRAVFEEQEFQWLQGEVNHERIAFAYKKQSLKCQKQAQMIAESDKVECELATFWNKKKGESLRRSPIFTRAKSLRLLSQRR